MKSFRFIGLVGLGLAPFASAAPKLAAGDEHTYRLHVESERNINLGMGLERHEKVTLDGKFELLVQEITDEGARVQLVWRELEAVPAGSVNGAEVTDPLREAWASAAATLIDQHLEMFVLVDGRLVSIEGITKLTPPMEAASTFDTVFGEQNMIALLQGVFMPTGKQHASTGVGVLACEVHPQDQKNKEGDVLAGVATLAVPDDLRSFPGLEPGTGEATGTLRWNEEAGRLEARTIEAKARIYKEGPPLTADIDAKSVMTLERVEKKGE